MSTWELELERRAQESAGERTRVRTALLVTALIHVVAFALRFPHAVVEAEPLEPEHTVFVIRNVRLRPPEPVAPLPPPPAPVERPPEPVHTVPVPAPPDAPEEPAEPAPPLPLPSPGPVVVVAPPAPPAPPVVERPDEPVPFDPASIERPRRVVAPLPPYTELARHMRVEGFVVLEAVIDTEGRVRDVRVVRPLPGGLDRSAVETIRTWRFEPARRDGRPIAVLYNLTVNFRLQ